MKPPGHYKIRYQRSAARNARDEVPTRDPIGALIAQVTASEGRVRRIVDSLREEIVGGEDEPLLRVRRIFSTPREIYRLEIERPALGYQRTTLLDRDALESLLEEDEVRDAFEMALSA